MNLLFYSIPIFFSFLNSWRLANENMLFPITLISYLMLNPQILIHFFVLKKKMSSRASRIVQMLQAFHFLNIYLAKKRTSPAANSQSPQIGAITKKVFVIVCWCHVTAAKSEDVVQSSNNMRTAINTLQRRLHSVVHLTQTRPPSHEAHQQF